MSQQQRYFAWATLVLTFIGIIIAYFTFLRTPPPNPAPAVWELTSADKQGIVFSAKADVVVHFVNIPQGSGQRYMDLGFSYISNADGSAPKEFDLDIEKVERFTGFRSTSARNNYQFIPSKSGWYLVQVYPNKDSVSAFDLPGAYHFKGSEDFDSLK